MIYIDENGNEIDYLAKRNEEIKEKLQDVLDEFLAEKKTMIELKKPANLGYRFTKQLHYVLSTYGQLSAEQVARLDYDTINDYWLKYLDLTAYYNIFFEIVDNKQLFMAFFGINNRIYTKLEKSDDEDIRNLMQSINDSFIGLGFTASESGNASAAAVRQRLGADVSAGHGVVAADTHLLVDKLTEQKTPQEMELQLESILGKKLFLGDGKK